MAEQVFLYRCGTCKHWSEHTGWRDPIEVYTEPFDVDRQHAITQAVNKGDLWGKCQGVEELPERTITADTKIEDIDVPLAVTRDGSGYMAELLTRAEFGCVLWEKIEVEVPDAS